VNFASASLSGTVPAANLPIGTAANTVAAGNDSRITGALQFSHVYTNFGTPNSAPFDLLCTNAGDVAIGGGAWVTSGNALRESRPVSAPSGFNGWRVTAVSLTTGMDVDASAAYVVCASP
jgi:hypothetical protein